MFLQGVMTRLLKERSSGAPIFLHGKERPHNALESLLSRKFNLHAPQRVISDGDLDGQKFLRTSRASAVFAYSPVASQNHISFCMDHKVSVRTNDAAITIINGKKVFLDQQDSLTRSYVELMVYERVDRVISATEPDGMRIRNKIIATHAIRHCLENETDIYIQDCGASHLVGNSGKDYKFEDSLVNQFQKAGFEVLPIFVSSPAFSLLDIPDEGCNFIEQKGISVFGLSYEQFFHDSEPGAEMEMMEAIAAESGGEIKIYPVLTPEEILQERKWVQEEYPQWLAEAATMST